MTEMIDRLGTDLIKFTLTAILVLAVLIAVYLVTKYILKMLNRLLCEPSKMISIEITPAIDDEKELNAAKEFYSILHDLLTSKTIIGKIFSQNHSISLEIIANKEEGIKYSLVAPRAYETAITGALATYIPTSKWKIESVDVNHKISGKYYTYKQTGYFALPLKKLEDWQKSDTVGYLSGALTKLKDNEKIIVQFVIEPREIREAKILRNKLIHNEALITSLGQKSMHTGVLGLVASRILFGLTDAIGNLFHGPSKIYSPEFQSDVRRRDISARLKPARTLSTIEQELSNSVHEKISEPLFGVSVRAFISANAEEWSRQKSLLAALNILSRPKVQSFHRTRLVIPSILAKRFEKRLPAISVRGASILSVSELASLMNFTNISRNHTEDLVKSLSRQLPAPLSLKQQNSTDVIIGKNSFQGRETNIGLTAAERERHMYIIGGTGNGKTTMLEYSIVQDIKNGKGVAVVDPHGDLSEKLLGYIPEDRINDVIYFNPDDLDHPIGLNLLELTPGLSGKELLREKDIITESVISVFRKIFSEEDTGGHRIEYVLRNAIQTALTVPDATLFTVFDLLNDPKYLKSIIAKLEDKNLKNFWKHELGKAGDMQKVKMSAGITAKIGRFLFSASAKQILEQPRSTINFDEILDSKKILICNLSKGLLGEDTSELFGITLLAKIQLASLRRVRHAQNERTPYYLYVDEFQNFATMSFVQMLSESRKYKLFLTMAEQSTSQQSDKDMVNIILANVGTVVCFRTGNPADEQILLPLFKPFINEGEINNLPTYNFFIRLAAVKSQEPTSGCTLVLENKPDKAISNRVIINSRMRYATPSEARDVSNAQDQQPIKQEVPLDSDIQLIDA